MTQIEIVLNEPAPVAPTVEVPTDSDAVEAQLADEIGNLWQVHSSAQSSTTR
jgi:ClpP class serine protease